MPKALTGRARGSGIVIAVLGVALSAQIDIALPGTPVPQSLQTFAVVLAGAWLGWLWGGVAMILYALVGALGLPVFAGGAAGFAVLSGPTAGYLVGFVLGAAFMGWWVSAGAHRQFWRLFVGAAVAHAIVLAVGWLRLAAMMGGRGAFEAGVSPFVWGGVVKSFAAAAVIYWAARTFEGEVPAE